MNLWTDMKNRDEIGIALLGFGNVGSGTYEVIEENFTSIKEKVGVKIYVKKILVRDLNAGRRVKAPAELLTCNPEDIFKDPSVDIVAELLGGLEPATEYMIRALDSGKHVVSANKAALAANLPQLLDAVERSGRVLRYEAAVCGAIPVMDVIDRALAANKISGISGIVNGTTNYILTRMGEEAADYASVLADAQRLGFAEADPSGDVEGFDAANKLSLLIWQAFGKYIHPDKIARKGITELGLADIDAAALRGNKIKLIAQADDGPEGVEASVAPREVPADSFLGRCAGEYNAVQLDCDMAGPIFLMGKGAGPRPTGSAVVGDIISIARDMRSGV
ncbi:MAG: homoserine dehydrogenase [Clostridiales bacterium]|nr:homoserine dehydrogenase [Clostridiales bacterium]